MILNTLLRKTSLVVASVGLLCASWAHAETLRLGHVTPPSHVWHKIAERIDHNLQEKSKGDMKVKRLIRFLPLKLVV